MPVNLCLTCQSLNIYVPHDDALSDVTDFKMAVAESSMEFISYKDQRSMAGDIFTTRWVEVIMMGYCCYDVLYEIEGTTCNINGNVLVQAP